ncbi:autophagy protein 5 [Linnemannia gamsii]|uniref:Autophagy protein 5 n=1 Tax=Linnemannia gamsii TaxID=64522 RepID=A0ABQ7K2T3_9FUNG|nr:autophagy protein 5 [Linnemannia gamsii]
MHTTSENPVAKVIWEGSIPIQFVWDPTETQGRILEPYFVEVPRCSYLSLIISQIRRDFAAKRLGFTSDESEMWFDYEDIPLKCQNFPGDKLIKNPTLKSCQDYFMSMIKEADYLRNGSTKKVMNMSKSDQTQLWEGLWSKSYDQFWGMNQRLVSNDGVLARHLPVRIYLPENCPVIQDLVSPLDEDGRPRTLRQILHSAVPDLFPLDVNSGLTTTARVLIHGVKPSLETDVCWAAQSMAYPDNFLHLVVVLD